MRDDEEAFTGLRLHRKKDGHLGVMLFRDGIITHLLPSQEDMARPEGFYDLDMNPVEDPADGLAISTEDKDWIEHEHPRDEIGRFTLGAGAAEDHQRVGEAHGKASREHSDRSKAWGKDSPQAQAHRDAAAAHQAAVEAHQAAKADPSLKGKAMLATSLAVEASHTSRAADTTRKRVHTVAKPDMRGVAKSDPGLPEKLRQRKDTGELQHYGIGNAHDYARTVHMKRAAMLPAGAEKDAHTAAAKAHRDARVANYQAFAGSAVQQANAVSYTNKAHAASGKTDIQEPTGVALKDSRLQQGSARAAKRAALAQQPALSHEAAEKMSDAEYKEKYGVVLRHVENGHGFAKDAKAANVIVRQAFAELPQSHRELISKRYRVHTVGLIDMEGRESTMGIGGVGNAAGLHSGSVGLIQIASHCGSGSDVRKQRNLAATTAHEVGHAVDLELGRPSKTAAFTGAFPPAGQRGTAYEEAAGKYFHKLPTEMWAECYSVAFDPAERSSYFHAMNRARAAKVYAKPIAAMKAIIERKLRNKGMAE